MAKNENKAAGLSFSKTSVAEKPQEVEAPKTGPATEKASKGKSAPTGGARQIVINTEVLGALLALDGSELITEALAKKMDPKWAVDVRTFTPTRQYASGEQALKTDIRGAVMRFVIARSGEKHDRPVPARDVNAFMHLAKGAVYTGIYDTGYLSSAKGDDTGNRGMVARGFLIKGKPLEAVAVVAAPESTPEPETASEAEVGESST